MREESDLPFFPGDVSWPTAKVLSFANHCGLSAFRRSVTKRQADRIGADVLHQFALKKGIDVRLAPDRLRAVSESNQRCTSLILVFQDQSRHDRLIFQLAVHFDRYTVSNLIEPCTEQLFGCAL
jgi:hypothetical protein